MVCKKNQPLYIGRLPLDNYIVIYISIEPVLTLSPTSVTETYGNVVTFTCQTNGTQLAWSVAGTVIDQSHTNNDMISVYTNNTSNGILSVLTIRAVPINGIGGITVTCSLTIFHSKSSTLKIIGTVHSFYFLY